MTRQSSSATWLILIWMLFTSLWSKGQEKPLKCMHVRLRWCVTDQSFVRTAFQGRQHEMKHFAAFCGLLRRFDAFLQPFCSLSVAFLQPFCNFFAAFLKPFCSLSAASLQPFCSLSAALLIIYFRQQVGRFFFEKNLFYIRKVVITRRPVK